jgi:hypothetical protein
MFMFTERGRVKWWEQGERRGMILAKEHATARDFVAWAKAKQGARISIAEIGTIDGETLAVQLDASLTEGANCAFILRTIDASGVTCDILEPPAQKGVDNE